MVSRLNAAMEQALNRQLNAEYYSSYFYLSMASYFEAINLKGFANWMRVQVQEENLHAMKFFNYILQRGGRVRLTEIAAPPTDWQSPAEVFSQGLAHEQKVTGLINNLVALSTEEKDFATNSFLQWFVNEQVEEEASFEEISQKLKLLGDNPGAGLFLIDRELATRVFTPPPAAADANPASAQ